MESENKDYLWQELTKELKDYCFAWGVEKTKRDFIRTFVFCAFIVVFLVASLFYGDFGIFQMFLAFLLVAMPIFVYCYSKSFQKNLQMVIQSEEAVYAIAVLKDVEIKTEEVKGILKQNKVSTLHTFLFRDGSVMALDTVVEKAKIGDSVLMVKRKNTQNLSSKNCFKIRYQKEED